MRVLIDCRMATWTGVGRYTTGLVRALARRSDLEVVAATAPDAPVLDASLATVVTAGNPFSPAGMLALGRTASRVAPDLTHCPHFPTPFPAPHPLVVTMHDLTPLLVEGVMPSPLRRALYRRQVARAVSVADALITLSRFTADEVDRYFPGALAKSNVTLAGADDFSAIPAGALDARLGALGASGAAQVGGPYVLTMGSTRKHKDVPTVLRAFALVATTRPDLRLLLVGEGDPGYVAAHLPDAPQDTLSRIAFTGHVTDDDLRALYANAAAFAFPSRYEGFGLPPLEAMALGAPVVSADAASLPEVVADAALTFPPGDDAVLASQLEAVLSDDALRERLVAAGRARAAVLTWDACAQRTADVYRRVAGR